MDVLEHLAHVVPEVQLARPPLPEPLRLEGPVEEDGHLNVGLLQRTHEGGQEVHHVAPLTPATPVGEVAAVQSVLHIVRILRNFAFVWLIQ